MYGCSDDVCVCVCVCVSILFMFQRNIIATFSLSVLSNSTLKSSVKRRTKYRYSLQVSKKVSVFSAFCIWRFFGLVSGLSLLLLTLLCWVMEVFFDNSISRMTFIVITVNCVMNGLSVIQMLCCLRGRTKLTQAAWKFATSHTLWRWPTRLVRRHLRPQNVRSVQHLPQGAFVLLISTDLISSELTSFCMNWVSVMVMWSKPIHSGCDWLELSTLHCPVRLVTATANWVTLQRSHFNSVQTKWG